MTKPKTAEPLELVADNEAPSISPVYLDDLPPTEFPNFRARRLTPDELGELEVEVLVRKDGEVWSCAMHDVSTSGVAFIPPEGLQLGLGERLNDLAVLFESHEVYRGAAKVRSIRGVDGSILVGAFFLDSPMNMEDVQQLRHVRERRKDPRLLFDASELAWHSGETTTHAFEAEVARLHLFLREAGRHFESLERDLPWHVLHGEKFTPARRALVQQLEQGFVPAYIAHTERIDKALRGAPADKQAAMKAFSRALLHDTLIQAPFMNRCLTKPLGYPGDYVVMQYLYQRHFEGQTLLAKAIHLSTVFTRGACAVRARKDMLRDEIERVTRARAAEGLDTRIISIAAGPAQETFELIERSPELIPHLDILLFDQDEDALEHVNNRLSMLRTKLGQPIRVQLRHDTIRRLLDDRTIFAAFGEADLIFSSGLFDYLRFHTGVRLIRNLFHNLAPGGHLFVGNMVPENPCRWFLEHHLEWFLEYRSREELRAMGEAAVIEATVEIIEESTEINPFLRLTKE